MTEHDWDGKSFPDGPLSSAEAAQMRHMFYVLSKSWVELDEKNLVVLDEAANLFRSLKTLGKIGLAFGGLSFLLVIGAQIKGVL